MFQPFQNSADPPEVSTNSTLLIFRKETRYSKMRWFRVRLLVDNLQNEEPSTSEMGNLGLKDKG